MSSREDILQSIRRNTRVRYEKPDLSALEHEALTYEDKLSKFCEVIKQVGGQAVILKDEENVNDVIKAAYPDAKRIASTIKEIKTGNTIQPITCSTFHPDDVEESGDLDGTDVAIVDGRIGVCENGAVWLTQDVEQRAVYFISEALVIILDRNNLVNNMHEAYKRIDTGEYGYGVFISGPSKTADIEQEQVVDRRFAGKTFVLTGALEHFSRDEASAIIERFGGKTSSSVSKKTSYLLAGENTGSKYQKALTLGTPIITEAEFLAMIQE